MNDVEQRMVKAVLLAAQVARSDLDWMIASCPDVDRARELYGRRLVATAPRPSVDTSAITSARDALVAARREGDEEKIAERYAGLLTACAIVDSEQEAAEMRMAVSL